MFKGLTRFIVYFLLCVPLVIVAVLIVKQIQYAFSLRSSFLNSNLQGSYINVQQAMAANELSTKTFFLVFVCFLMILCGLFLILRGTENAFRFTKEPRVRYSLKTAAPGVVMTIAGSLVLAYSIFQSQQQQANLTTQLHTLAMVHSISTNGRDQEVAYQQPSDTNIAKQEVEETGQEALPDKETLDGKVDKAVDEQAMVAAASIVAAMPEEISWANELASRSVAFGYDPTNEDFKAYNDIVARAGKTERGHKALNNDLQWAFTLLQRTKNGYQPTNREMSRYEAVVTDQLREKDKVTVN